MSPSPRRFFRPIPLLIVLALLVGAGWYWTGRDSQSAPRFRTAKVERGDIRVAISATGSLAALSTIDVGSEVSGRIAEVPVDFNDRVERGQIIARIEPSTFEAQVEQSQATIANARASLRTAQAALRNAELDLGRKRSLSQSRLISRGELDLAIAAHQQAQAQVASAEAQIRQQEAASRNARLNLERTVIRSPVDGVVLVRAIEPGQTVAASLQAPVLFRIAEDLSQMEIVLAVDESDIGQVRPGQSVGFTVDAFPERRFKGEVRQVRLSSTTTSNVVTYPVVVAVDNADQTLLPGMTANAEIEVSRKRGVLTVPNAALRFKPPVQDSAGAPTAPARNAGIGDDLVRIADGLRLQPAQREVFDRAQTEMRERMAARAAARTQDNNGASLFGRGPGGPSQGQGGGGDMGGAMRQRMLERVNQQFGDFRATLDEARRRQWDDALQALVGARRAPVHVLADGKPKAVTVRVGASDGNVTEIAGDLKPGDEVIVGVQVAEPKK